MTKTCLLSLLMAGGLTMLATLSAPAADKDKKADKKPAATDPPGTAAIMNQYRGWFATNDLNKDTYLDKDELAKAFRGVNARAYDYRPPTKTDKEPAKTADLDKDVPPKEATSGKELTPEQQAQLQAYYTRFPDYQFLTQLDKNRDEKVGLGEFETWARDLAKVYAEQLKQMEDAQKRVLDLQARLLRNPKDRNRLDDELRRERRELDRLRDRIRDLEKQQERFRRNNR